MLGKRFIARVVSIGVIGVGALSAAPAHADPVVPIDWKVDATTTLKKLDQTVVIPTGSFVGGFDLGTSQLSGDLSLPQASKRLDIGQLPLANITFAMKQAAPVTGTVDLATMQASTVASFNVQLVSIRPVIAPWLNLVGNTCQTAQPVTTSIGGTVDLINGSTFSGTYELGKFARCGLLVTPIINAIVPGPGNTMTAKFSPRA